jgi:hypothetical protein
LNAQVKKDAQKESEPQHIKPTIPNIECLHKMCNSKGMFHRHTQQQTPNNEAASKGCATSRGVEPNIPKHNLNSNKSVEMRPPRANAQL